MSASGLLVRTRALALSVLFVAAASCGRDSAHTQDIPARPPETVRIEQRTVPASGVVRGFALHPGEEGPYLTWLQRSEASALSEQSETSWRVLVSQFDADRWTAPTVAVREDQRPTSFFANWADTPSLMELPGGLFSPRTLYLHWLEKIGDGTYAYGAQLVSRRGDREPWQERGLLHDDTSATEHGFVSYVVGKHDAWAFWLDGRAMANDGPMSLRATTLSAAGPVHPSQLLDESVCECCPTDAALTPEGPVVVYRNRSTDETRDIWSVRWEDGRWSAPAPVHVDGWRINGCPVNGPAIAADGDRVVAAWYTGAQSRRRVFAAVSLDSGRNWSDPVLVDGNGPYGRVDVAFASGYAWISWLGSSLDGPAVLLRALDVRAQSLETPREPPAPTSGEPGMSAPFRLGQPKVVALTSAARSYGFPKSITFGAGLLLAWMEPGPAEQPQLQTAQISFN